jgi:hypothetical protein
MQYSLAICNLDARRGSQSMRKVWPGLFRTFTLAARAALARLRRNVHRADAVTHHDAGRSARAGIERRADAFTADLIQIGISFMKVFGRENAEAFFLTAGIEPAVYRRVIAGRFRMVAPDGDADTQGVPA